MVLIHKMKTEQEKCEDFMQKNRGKKEQTSPELLFVVEDKDKIEACVQLIYFKPRGIQNSLPCKLTKRELKDIAVKYKYPVTDMEKIKMEALGFPYDPDFDPYFYGKKKSPVQPAAAG